MANNKSIVTHEHPHTKMVRRTASNKKTDTVGLTIILGMLAGVFISCLIIDPHYDSFKEIIIELVKYVGGSTSAGAIIGLILGEILRREHINLHLKYRDKHQVVGHGEKRIKEKEMKQGVYWGDHTLGDNSLLKDSDEWLMRR
jgi:hypothetical protein